MKTPEEIKKALKSHSDDDGYSNCLRCPYDDGEECEGGLVRDALAYIEQLEETIDLMKIQMHGDCGTCKHRNDDRVKEDARLRCKLSPACYECLSRGGRSQWEYEGLPEVKRHAQSV